MPTKANKPSSWNFDNSYSQLNKKFFSAQLPAPVKDARAFYFNLPLAKELGLDFLLEDTDAMAAYLGGNEIPPGAEPLAQAYAGHQFGYFNILGDGRAVLLGEQITPDKQRFDIQLKGAGQTPYSRSGDGRATLSSMLREYLISEALYFLRVPTTRSLAVVTTGEPVFRQETALGAVLTRVASSHIRVGSFEYVKYFGDKEELQAYTDYVINRHYPELAQSDNPALALLERVMHKQVDLVVNWMRIGFIHGVMNTDNCSIAGESIDFGPCAFMNAYNPATVFSSIDRDARYAFANQPYIVRWNLAILASSLLPLIHEEEEQAVELVKKILDDFVPLYGGKYYRMHLAKLGIREPQQEDKVLVDDWLSLLEQHSLDYTNSYQALRFTSLRAQVFGDRADVQAWIERWEARLGEEQAKAWALMEVYNPRVIPRNHLVEAALEKATKGEVEEFNALLTLFAKTYSVDIEQEGVQEVPASHDACYQTFCGT